jgi:glycerol-3-phosphate acyltransferase PlsY
VDETFSIAITVVAAYVVGATPFGLIIGKTVAGIDIRDAGSGNIGATNVGRTLGAKWGVVVLLLDATKGLLPTLLLPLCLKSGEIQNRELLGVIAGVSTIVGHMFPFWLGFRGGKGVATSLGVVVVLAPWGSLAGLCGFALTVFLTRIIALSSMIAAIAFGVCQMIILAPKPFATEHIALAIFSLAIPLLIIVRHRSNIGRLIRGEEKRFSFASRELAENSKESVDVEASESSSSPNQ